MRDFVFHNTTRVLFGSGVVREIGRQAALFGRRILLVHGRDSIHRYGLFPVVEEALRDAGLTAGILGGVRPNPEVDLVRKGCELARGQGTEVVVAVGGGSVMDTAKAIAAGALVRHDPWLFFRGKKSIRCALPVLCVPTVAGSGSEINGGMVLGNAATRRKIGIGNRHLLPKAALLDPDLIATVPAEVTAFAAVDALCHLLEPYLHREEAFSPLQDHYSEALMRSLMESCRTLRAAPGDPDGRADLMWAATLAMNGLGSAGLGRIGFPLHMIEHSLSALYDLPHGAGMAALLPGAMRFQARTSPARFARFAAGVMDLAHEDEPTLAREGIRELGRWLRATGLPACLADLGVTAEEIPAIAANTGDQARLWRLGRFPPQIVEGILRECLEREC